MKPSEKKIEKEISRLRKFIDETNGFEKENIIQRRMAYCLETVLRWTLEETISWNMPLEECLEESSILISELEEV